MVKLWNNNYKRRFLHHSTWQFHKKYSNFFSNISVSHFPFPRWYQVASFFWKLTFWFQILEFFFHHTSINTCVCVVDRPWKDIEEDDHLTEAIEATRNGSRSGPPFNGFYGASLRVRSAVDAATPSLPAVSHHPLNSSAYQCLKTWIPLETANSFS